MVRGGVLFGTSPDELDTVQAEDEEPSFYHAMHPNGKDKYASPFYHHVELRGLEPSTTYYYKVLTRETLEEFDSLQSILNAGFSSSASKEEQELKQKEVHANVVEETFEEEIQDEDDNSRMRSLLRMDMGYDHRFLAPPPYDSTQCECPDPHKIRSFTTAPEPNPDVPVKFAVIGDIGQFPHSEETIEHLMKNHNGVQAIMLAGDLAYAAEDNRRWDTFLDFLDDYPIVEEIPMQITAGNHDIDKYEHGDEIFLAYERRFRMPRAHQPRLGKFVGEDGRLNMDRPPYPLPYEYGNAYYSFIYGSVHWIVLSSYSAMEPDSVQYQWLIRELSRVDRTKTPWLMVMFHCPLYNSFSVHQRDTQIIKAREFFEPLLVKHRANMVFNGHIHAYLRTKNVAHQSVNATGPMHVVVGAGGRDAHAPFLHEEPEEWVAVRDAALYGYGMLEILNQTHARWDWVHTGNATDHNVLVNHEGLELPLGGADHIVLENQYFMKE